MWLAELSQKQTYFPKESHFQTNLQIDNIVFPVVLYLDYRITKLFWGSNLLLNFYPI